MLCPLVNGNLKAQLFTYHTHPPFILKSSYSHNTVYKISFKIFWYILKDKIKITGPPQVGGFPLPV